MLQRSRRISLAFFFAIPATLHAGDSYLLTATPGAVDAGDSIEVCWSVTGPTRPSDWVAMYRVGDPNTSYLAYTYTSGQPNSCYPFTAPLLAGTIEFRYLPDNSYTSVAASNTVDVRCVEDNHCYDNDACTADKCHAGACSNIGPQDAMILLTGEPNPAPLRDSLRACWSASSGFASQADWIGLYSVGANDIEYQSFQYTGGGDDGCVDLLPPPVVGTYELRYFVQNQYCAMVQSGPIEFCDPALSKDCPCYKNESCDDDDPCSVDTCVANRCAFSAPDPVEYMLDACPPDSSPGLPLTVCWAAPDGSSISDWIALYKSGTTVFEYLNFQYTNGSRNGCMEFPSPGSEGDFFFRYLLDNGYCAIKESNEVTVCDGCTPASANWTDDFVICQDGPAVPVGDPCRTFDWDCSGYVDLLDAAYYQRLFR